MSISRILVIASAILPFLPSPDKALAYPNFAVLAKVEHPRMPCFPTICFGAFLAQQHGVITTRCHPKERSAR